MRKVTLTFNREILFLFAVILIGLFGATLFGTYKLYKRVVATEKMQQEIIATQAQAQLEQEQKAKDLLDSQAQQLAVAQQELETAKNDARKNSQQIQNLTDTLNTETKVAKDTVITSNDLFSYTTGVVQVVCSTNGSVISGSGSLFTFKDLKQAVLTNFHVVKGADKCVIIMTNTANTPTGMFEAQSSVYTYNNNTDEAILAIGPSVSSASVPIANYNYSLSTVRKCPSPLPVGTPVVIIGFPAYARRDSTITIDTIGTVSTIYRTATNGIISGYDTSGHGDPNYFVSAKIDAGNSGGAALAKDSNGLCMLGLPTWLTVGNYETQGLVQNITNVLPSN